ncbi:transcription factor BIM2-like isoform X2 [Typha latifolia]|uniref:transcription factor BIM2-like isoform X2 n=1 Tax=Typha latifolia TaxID=4733 RepID=UPI003C2CE684
MEAASGFSRGFDDDDDGFADEFPRRETSSSSRKGPAFSLASFAFLFLSVACRANFSAFEVGFLMCGFVAELSVKIDGKGSGSGTDQRPNTPRSKHSATEQRRRSKINDRFQILRELIPNSDQKRDKASFLLEVIEYIQFLQEKMHKYESTCPGWDQDNPKLMPWVKVYFRSFWKNAQNNTQPNGDGLSDPSQLMKNGSTPSDYLFSGRYEDNSVPMPPAVVSDAEIPAEAGMVNDISYRATETSQDFANNNMTQAQDQWLRPSGVVDSAVSSETSEQEELIIDESTINLSNAYSQGLLSTLTEALQNSGLDPSQASISVQINLGRRPKRLNANATICSKDQEDPASTNQAIGHSRMGSSGEESSQAPKRQKASNS